jgi:hypothetical protein
MMVKRAFKEGLEIYFFHVAVFAMLVLFPGCMNEDIVLEDPSFNRPVSIAAPLFNAHFAAIDIIDRIAENDYIDINENGLVCARLDTVVSVSYDDVIKIDNFSYKTSYDLNPYLKATNISYHFTDTIQSELETDKRLDSIVVNSGVLELYVKTPDGFSGSWKITFPDIITSNGDAVSFAGTFDGSKGTVIDLDNSTMKFFIDKEGVSSIRMITDIDVSVTGGLTDTEFAILVDVNDVEPYSVFGYFGTETIKVVQDEITIDFFDDENFSDMLTFKDINFSLVTTNRFGVPLALSLDTVLFTKETTGEELFLNIPDNNTIKLSSAVYDAENDTVYPVSDSLVLDKDNSNIVDAVNLGPDKMYYYVSGIVNPDGDAGDQNFIINDGNNEFNAEARITIPFWFKTEKYERTDTIDFNFRDIIDDSTTIDRIKEVNLYFSFDNGFPFSIFSQAYVVDENFNVIDSLFDSTKQLWKSPPIDSDDRATGTEHTDVDILLDNEKIEKFYYGDAMNIILYSLVNTGDSDSPEFVKLYSDYVIDIHMAFDMVSNE